MRMIFLSSFLLSLLSCALSQSDLVGGGVIGDSSGPVGAIFDNGETSVDFGGGGESPSFGQFGSTGFANEGVIGGSSSPIGSIFGNGETSVNFGGGESSPSLGQFGSTGLANEGVIGGNSGALGAIFNEETSVEFQNGESLNQVGSTGLVNGIDEFTDLATSANYWSYELGPALPSLDYDTNLPTNIWLQGGFLYIQALKESFKGAQYTSASLSSQGKVSVQYGLFVIRAKFSYTKGVYPLYMLSSDDRSSGVIVMGGGISPNTIYSQVFTPSSSSPPANYTLPSGMTEDFHDYAVLWQPSQMEFYIDSVLYSSINATSFGGQWPFDTIKMFANIRLAVGGPFGNPDASSVFPQQLVVDAVGIFQG